MDHSKQQPTSAVHPKKIKEETKLVLEAFLKRTLSQEEGSNIGHVGRVYHDPTKYSHRQSRDGHLKASQKHSARPIERKGSKPPAREKEHVQASHKNGSWGSLHEEINRVEEKKHGFKTSMKHLLRRPSQAKEKGGPPKNKTGTTPTKSRDSLDGVLEESKRGSGPGDSKRPKTPNPFMACAVAPQSPMGTEEEPAYGLATEKPSSQGARRKTSKSFSLKHLLKKKSSGKEVDRDHQKTPLSSPRPTTLPLKPCYDGVPAKRPDDDPGIYNIAAKQLDKLVRHPKMRSPTADIPHPMIAFHGLSDKKAENNNIQPECDKEEVVRKLVALLQEQAVVINEQIENEPMLKGALSRMSYRSFSRLAEVFTSQAEALAPELPVSPELTKIALTMELTRKVAGINSHPVQTLMGYSMAYMDMFVPWLQQQGGWENIVCQEDVLD